MTYREVLEEVSSVQDSISKIAPPSFDESDLENLRVVTRLVVEFYCYLTDPQLNSDYTDPRYQCDSAFSGLECFWSLVTSYRVDDESLELLPVVTSTATLKHDYLSKYGEFMDATSFAERCRLLLDLFRLHIIFAGMNYR